jgi:hypothetical protein
MIDDKRIEASNMAKLRWYRIKFLLVGIREFEFPQAVNNFEEVISGFPNIRNVNVSLEENNTILVQLDIEDLADLKTVEVGDNTTEQMLETLSAVLIEPWDVTIRVVETDVVNYP